MSKFLKIATPALGGVASVLTLAYVLADQFVTDIPAPMRGTVTFAPAMAETAPASEEPPEGDAAQTVVEAEETVTETAEETEAEMPEATEGAPGDTAEAPDSEDADPAPALADTAEEMPEAEPVEDATAPAEDTSAPQPASAPAGGSGLGRAALEEEIAAWDIDIRPDGLGLPEGSGDVLTGEEVFVERCASCHGDFGEGAGRWPQLAGGQGTLERDRPVKTIGSYWPYLSTVWDYVHRAMPFGEAQSLTADETYALTAYLLYLNDIVEDDFVLSRENFLEVEMPNAEAFYMDDRAEAELPLFSGEVCMTDCKEAVEITMRAAVLDVTPDAGEGLSLDEGGAATPAAGATTTETSEEPAPSEGEAPAESEAAAEAPAAEGEATAEATEAEGDTAPEADATADATDPAAAPAADAALIAAGEAAFRQCRSCHQLGEGAVSRTGPHLNGLDGRVKGSVDGFRYSNVFQQAQAAGETWDTQSLTAFLKDPRGAMPGTKMAFRGVREEADIAALLAYIEDAGQ